MKKTFRMLALAAVAMTVAVACNNASEATEDSTIDTIAIEAIVEDTTPVVDTVVAEPVATKPAKTVKQEKKTTKAADQNVNNASTGTATFGAANPNATKNANATSAAEQNVNNANTGTSSFGVKKN